MVALRRADAPVASAADLTRSGFSEAQAEAIVDIVQTTTDEAVEMLKNELSRWHAYLALYMLVQIGIVLLMALVIQALRAPFPGAL